MNYENETTERGKINNLYYIVVIIILGIFLLNGDGLFNLKSNSLDTQSIVSEDGGKTFSRGTDIEDTPDINNQITDSSLIKEPNACGSMMYGYPDYTGTNKEGLGCADTIISERDLECLSNPPLNYDGIIDLGSPNKLSDPEITCCDADGTCEW